MKGVDEIKHVVTIAFISKGTLNGMSKDDKKHKPPLERVCPYESWLCHVYSFIIFGLAFLDKELTNLG